jgi:hypothetical protein
MITPSWNVAEGWSDSSVLRDWISNLHILEREMRIAGLGHTLGALPGIYDPQDHTYLICIDWEGAIVSQGRPSTQELSCQHVDCNYWVIHRLWRSKYSYLMLQSIVSRNIKGLHSSILTLYGRIVGSCVPLQPKRGRALLLDFSHPIRAVLSLISSPTHSKPRTGEPTASIKSKN